VSGRPYSVLAQETRNPHSASMTIPSLLQDDASHWDEVARRILIVKTCFLKACGQIPTGSGLEKLLQQAEAAHAIRTRTPEAKMSPEQSLAVQVVWRLANNLQTLLERRIDFDHHLMVMKNGDPIFGQRDDPGKEGFKDFELELYTATNLCTWSTRSVVLHKPGHPFDVTFSDKLHIDCKHPSSQGNKVARAITALGKALEPDLIGAMVVGVEDLLGLDRALVVRSYEEVTLLVETKFKPILDERSKGWRTNFEVYPNILGVFFTASIPLFVVGEHAAESTLYPLRTPGLVRQVENRDTDALFREFLTAMKQ
jgi:hypothetical protein